MTAMLYFVYVSKKTDHSEKWKIIHLMKNISLMNIHINVQKFRWSTC